MQRHKLGELHKRCKQVPPSRSCARVTRSGPISGRPTIETRIVEGGTNDRHGSHYQAIHHVQYCVPSTATRRRGTQGGSLGLHDALFALLEHSRGTYEARATRLVAP
jgi:hypothetical protein